MRLNFLRFYLLYNPTSYSVEYAKERDLSSETAAYDAGYQTACFAAASLTTRAAKVC
nr:hypothetical protein Q903MT_gene5957 [Picea sitchensis]